jgi:recombinational DNA repair protein RecR
LVEKVKQGEVKEVIFCIKLYHEGDTTNFLFKQILKTYSYLDYKRGITVAMSWNRMKLLCRRVFYKEFL